MTTYEKIKAMSVEEMAEQISNIGECWNNCPARHICDDCRDMCCIDVVTKWLKSEVEE